MACSIAMKASKLQTWADERTDGFVGADGHDAVAAQRQRLHDAAVGILGVNLAVKQYEVGRRRCRRGAAPDHGCRHEGPNMGRQHRSAAHRRYAKAAAQSA
jgi:hypothetical protein